MARWFRIYDEMLDDPKVQMLSPELFRAWMNALCLASQNGGTLPPMAQVAFRLRMSTADAQSRIDDLILAGLIDIRADKRLEPHNWSKRQWRSDDSADRVRRHRAQNVDKKPAAPLPDNGRAPCNGDVTVTVTPPDSESDAETDPHVAHQLSTAAHVSASGAAAPRRARSDQFFPPKSRATPRDRRVTVASVIDCARRIGLPGVVIDDAVAEIDRRGMGVRTPGPYLARTLADPVGHWLRNNGVPDGSVSLATMQAALEGDAPALAQIATAFAESGHVMGHAA